MKKLQRIKQEDKTPEDKRGGTQQSPAEFLSAKLKESGLTPTDGKTLGFQPYTYADSAALNLQRAGAGFKLPYCTADQKPLPMFRYRYQETAVSSGLAKGGKLRKYDQPANTDPEIYFPRLQGVNWPVILAEPTSPIIITEGELKAACATKHGHPTIGVGGVYSFGRKSRHQVLLPALQAIKWKERVVYLCYDSDAITNPKVLIAENRLARALTDVGAIVYVVRLPADGEAKVGLDDYIVKRGVAAFEELLAATVPWAALAPLHEINSLAAYIANPSMVVIYPTATNPEYDICDVQKFVNERFAPYKLSVENDKGKVTVKKAAAEWISWPARNELAGVVYEPGQDRIVNNRLNMWQGWGGEAIEGDVSWWDRLMCHMFKNSVKDRQWFERWAAYPIQHPGTKLKTAVVFWSNEQGTGKTFVGEVIGKLYGDRNFSLVNKDELTGSFNGWAANKQFVLGEEITGGSGRNVADKLKNMITGKVVNINEKYRPSYTLVNRMNYMFTSNHADALFMGAEDRRYFVHEVPPKPDKSIFDFVAFDKWVWQQSSIDALLYYFLHLDLGDFEPQDNAPHTEAKEEMIESAEDEQSAWIRVLKENPDKVLRLGDIVLNRDMYTTDELMQLYDPPEKHRRNNSDRTFAIKLKAFGFKRVGHGRGLKIDIGKHGRDRLWAIRNPADADLTGAAASVKYLAAFGNKRVRVVKHAGK